MFIYYVEVRRCINLYTLTGVSTHDYGPPDCGTFTTPWYWIPVVSIWVACGWTEQQSQEWAVRTSRHVRAQNQF